jgi:hypothetical protein
MGEWYRRLIISRPWITLLCVLLLLGMAGSQLDKLRLDASSDSLLLQGDPDLAFFREVAAQYESQEFLVLTWRPREQLLSDDALATLADLVDDLREIGGVSSVLSILDVPLLESPPIGLAQMADADAVSTLRNPAVDRKLAFAEFTTSPLYKNLLVGETGDISAVQVLLANDEAALALLEERESLRHLATQGAVSAEQGQRLAEVERAYDEASAQYSARRSQLVADVRAVADQYRDRAEIFVGGVPMIAADMLDFVAADLENFGMAIIVLMAVVLAAIFRHWRWVVIPLVNCSVVALLMLGLLAFFDWRMTVISSNFVAVLLIITLSLSIHLIVRYREIEHKSPAAGRAQHAMDAARLMLLPCLYTALTTIVAFTSLVVSGLQPVIDFGWMMTVGIAVAFLMTFVLVPSLMAVLPAAAITSAERDVSFTRHLGKVVEHRGGWIIGVSIGLVVATIIGVSRIQVENRFIDYFKKTTEIYQGMELLDRELGGTIPLDIVLYPPADFGASEPEDTSLYAEAPSAETGADDGFFSDDPFAEDGDIFAAEGATETSYWFTVQGRAEIDAAHTWLDRREETGKVLSLATTFEVLDGIFGTTLGGVEMALIENSLPEEVSSTLVEPYFSAASGQARITLRAKETSENLRRDAFLREVNRALEQDLGLAPDRFALTGLLVLYNNVLQSLFTSQILTLGLVFVAIGLMFWVLFRSLSLALLALAPNILAAGLVLGIMGLGGIPLDIMTITIAAIVVGIGVDDCIHYIHRFREEFAVDGDYHGALHRSHGSIGRAMFYTTLTIVLGFSLLTLSNFTPSIYFGTLTVIAMVAAVAGALLLLPKLLIVFKPLGPVNDTL